MGALRLTCALAVVMVGTGACSSPPSSPVAPNPPASAILTGTWSGDVTESYGGRGRLRLVIEQVQVALTGTFQLEFEDPTRNRQGTVSGNVASSALPGRMQLTSTVGMPCQPGQSPQSFLQVSWVAAADRLTGTYTGFGCVGTITGTFDVKRE